MDFFIFLILMIPYLIYLKNCLTPINMIKTLKLKYKYSSKNVAFKMKILKYVSYIIFILQIHAFIKEMNTQPLSNDKNINNQLDSYKQNNFLDDNYSIKSRFLKSNDTSFKRIYNENKDNEELVVDPQKISHDISVLIISIGIGSTSFVAGYLVYNDIVIKNFISKELESETIQNIQGESAFLLKVVKSKINPINHSLILIYNGSITLFLIFFDFYLTENYLMINVLISYFSSFYTYFLNIKSDKIIKSKKQEKNKIRTNNREIELVKLFENDEKQMKENKGSKFKVDIKFNKRKNIVQSPIQPNQLKHHHRKNAHEDLVEPFISSNLKNEEFEENNYPKFNKTIENKVIILTENEFNIKKDECSIKLIDDYDKLLNYKLDSILIKEISTINLKLSINNNLEILNYHGISCTHRLKRYPFHIIEPDKNQTHFNYEDLLLKIKLRHNNRDKEVKRAVKDFYFLENIVFLILSFDVNSAKKENSLYENNEKEIENVEKTNEFNKNNDNHNTFELDSSPKFKVNYFKSNSSVSSINIEDHNKSDIKINDVNDNSGNMFSFSPKQSSYLFEKNPEEVKISNNENHNSNSQIEVICNNNASKENQRESILILNNEIKELIDMKNKNKLDLNTRETMALMKNININVLNNLNNELENENQIGGKMKKLNVSQIYNQTETSFIFKNAESFTNNVKQNESDGNGSFSQVLSKNNCPKFENSFSHDLIDNSNNVKNTKLKNNYIRGNIKRMNSRKSLGNFFNLENNKINRTSKIKLINDVLKKNLKPFNPIIEDDEDLLKSTKIVNPKNSKVQININENDIVLENDEESLSYAELIIDYFKNEKNIDYLSNFNKKVKLFELNNITNLPELQIIERIEEIEFLKEYFFKFLDDIANNEKLNSWDILKCFLNI